MRGGSSAQHEVIRLIERCADHLLGRVYAARRGAGSNNDRPARQVASR